MKLKERDSERCLDLPISESLATGLQKLMSGLRYDSLSTYIHLFENGISDDPLSELQQANLSGLIETKNGQDCYDVLFELQASVPGELTPRIVGCPNYIHITEAQMRDAPYLHVAMTVVDPSNCMVYLLDPGKWILEPLALKPGTVAYAQDGNVFTVIQVTNSGFVIDEHKVKKDRHDTIAYEWVDDNFSINQNYVGYMRLRERYNCITSVVRDGTSPFYLKYLFESATFSGSLPEGQVELTPDEVVANAVLLDEVFEELGFSAKIRRFVDIFQRLPEGFWL